MSCIFLYFWARMVRRIFIIKLATLLLICNVGVPVYTHICHTMGKSWSSIFRPAKSCCSKRMQKTQVNTCHFPQTETSLRKGLCCENQQEILQLHVDYLQNQLSKDKTKPTPDIHVSYAFASLKHVFSSISNCWYSKAHGPPGKLHGRSLLIAQQIFRC